MCRICSAMLGFESYVCELIRVVFMWIQSYGTIHFICEIVQKMVSLGLILLIGRGYYMFVWTVMLYTTFLLYNNL
jgi:hypothetical protein